MAKVLDFSGDNEFCPGGGFVYKKPQAPSLLLSLGRHVDVYFTPSKRARVSAPFVVRKQQKSQPSIDEILPEECLFEIFRRLEGGQERSSCALVSKRWLMLLSSIGRDEVCTRTPEPVVKSDSQDSDMSKENDEIDGPHGFLSRCLEGKKATDVRLAAISVGTASRGGLGKLSIRGNNSTCKLTDLGLKFISRGCPSLKSLSLWNLSSVGDEGVAEIATGCRSLEKLDLCHCPAITDKGLIMIAANCPNLRSVSIESCPNIGDEGIKALGQNCPNLKSITLKNCPLIGDHGIAGLLTSPRQVLAKVDLQTLGISDGSLAVIGHYGSEITELTLGGLQNVNERGFWLMGKGQGLKKLKSLSITSCHGVTDAGLDAVARGCPNLNTFVLKKCPLVSDYGVMAVAKAGGSLESLKLEETHRVTLFGVFEVVANCNAKKLKELSLVKCLGIKDAAFRFPLTTLCYSLRSLTIKNCPGMGDFGLTVLGRLCPNLTHVDLTCLRGITDKGVLPLFKNPYSGVANVNLSRCLNLTDYVVCEITRLHGETLEVLNLDGCKKISDVSLVAVGENCMILCELDVSGCKVTDYGTSVLAGADHLGLQILSVADCCLVTEKSLPFFGILGESLFGLNIQNCSGIGYGAVNLIIEQLWKCDVLY